MKNLCAICILCMIIYSNPTESRSADSPFDSYWIADQFDSTLLANMYTYKIPGAAAAILMDDKVIYKEVYGFTKANEGARVTPSTLFRLASLSKGFSAVLAGDMVESGLINWDEPVTDILPDLHLNTQFNEIPITIRDILGHTSGFPSYAGTEMLENNLSYMQLLGYLQSVPLTVAPGERFNYQNVVFNLITDVIKMKTGLIYEQYAWQKIFMPLGMYDTCVGLEAFNDSPDHAWPHILVDSTWLAVDVKPSYYRVPASAGINASVDDMIPWLRALLGHAPEVVSPAILREIMQPRIATEKNSRYFGEWEHLGETWYGMGWRIFAYRDMHLVYHGGYVEGFRAELALLPEQDIGVIVLMNAATPFANNCIPMFLEILNNINVHVNNNSKE